MNLDTSYTAIVTGGHHAAKASKKRCFGYELRGNSTTFAAAHKQELKFGLQKLRGNSIKFAAAYKQELEFWLSLDKSHRWAACSKSFKKRCCDYELRGNSTAFAAAHKQEIEHRLSCMAIVTGGQQQKLQKL